MSFLTQKQNDAVRPRCAELAKVSLKVQAAMPTYEQLQARIAELEATVRRLAQPAPAPNELPHA